MANFEARQAIRETWMSYQPSDLNGTALFDIRTAFLLGQTINDTGQNDVLIESNTYRDIIQEGFIDAYLNLWVEVPTIVVILFQNNLYFPAGP